MHILHFKEKIAKPIWKISLVRQMKKNQVGTTYKDFNFHLNDKYILGY